MKQYRIQDLKMFEEQIFNVVQEYIDDIEVYSTDAVLQIDNLSRNVFVDSPSKMANIDNVPLFDLISINKNEIDCDRIDSLLSK